MQTGYRHFLGEVQLTLARELKLINESNLYTLISNPVKELESLRSMVVSPQILRVKGDMDISQLVPFNKAPIEILIKFNLKKYREFNYNNGKIGIQLSNQKLEKIQIGYDLSKEVFFIDRTKSSNIAVNDAYRGIFEAPSCLIKSDTLIMHLFIDKASVELFGQNGKSIMTDTFFPSEDYDQLNVFSKDCEINVFECKVWKLNSIW